MTTRKLVLFIVAIVLLILVIYQSTSGRTARQAAAQMVPVVVAKSDIPPFTILTAAQLMTTTVASGDASDAFRQPDELLGRLTTEELRAGNTLRRAQIIPVAETWDGKLNEMLIFSFYVSTPRIVGGQLRPGHHIDLLGTRPETREQVAQSLWLARDLWVVQVKKTDGSDVLRPEVSLREGAADLTPTPTRAAGLGLAGGLNSARAVEGPANLVMVAVDPETAQMLGDYMGARLFDAWVYVRPAGGQSAGTGRIDGIVFYDQNQDLIQQRNEVGLDNVTITLMTSPPRSVTTASGGLFTFDNIAPGTYTLAQEQPEGYVSLSSSRLNVVIAPGLNRHVVFANVRDGELASLGTKSGQTSAVVAQPAGEPTATPAAPADAAQARYRATLHMSNRQYGPPVIGPFAAGTQEAWVVITFTECPPNTPFRLLAYQIAEGDKNAERANGTWQGGAGTLSLPLKPWTGGEFAAGGYITAIKLGAGDEGGAFVAWSVEASKAMGPTTAPGTTPAEPNYPETGEQAAPGATAEPPTTHFGFAPAR
jgi:Flp pilus assembly protein CpaB